MKSVFSCGMGIAAFYLGVGLRYQKRALSVFINLRERLIWPIICVPGSLCSLKKPQLSQHVLYAMCCVAANRKWNLTGSWKVPASPHLSTKAQWKVPEWNNPVELSVTGLLTINHRAVKETACIHSVYQKPRFHWTQTAVCKTVWKTREVNKAG